MDLFAYVLVAIFISALAFIAFKKSRGRKPEVQDIVYEFVKLHADTEVMKRSARESTRPVAILKPQIPIGDDFSVGWFGGRPALPEHISTPEQDGHRMVFLGQINLSEIPKEIWSGLGPRSGWLAFFLPKEGPHKPTVLHFDGPLVEAWGDNARNAGWTSQHNFEEPFNSLLPKWPITVESIPGNELHNTAMPNSPPAGHLSMILDPAYHPFNIETKELLLRCLSENIVKVTKNIIRFPLTKKLHPEDAKWFERQRLVMLDTFERFFELEAVMSADQQTSEEDIAGCIEQLASLRICDYSYLRNGDDGFCELELREGNLFDHLSDRPALWNWWYEYNSGLTNHALYEYTSLANSLPNKLRERLEKTWQNENPFGFGSMGNAPQGHIYTPHGPDSPNEVLLELQTSRIAGWIWGDCYSIVFLIKRSDLKKGEFGSVMHDITN